MLLIKEMKSIRDKSGKLRKLAEFLCPFCFQIVEKDLYGGLKVNSCGCKRNELIGNSNRGKKRTKEQINNMIFAQQKIAEKMSLIKQGHETSQETREKISKANRGKKRTGEQNRKQSERMDGVKTNPCSEETKTRIGQANKGKKRTEEQNKKQSEIMKGKKLTEEHKQKIGVGNKGKIVLEETRNKIALSKLGNKNYNWNNGSSFEPYSPEFNKELKQQILERDNYTCQDPNCEHKSNRLHVHHIDYDKKNSNPENLITLCNSCHSKTNSKPNRVFWEKFYKNKMEEKWGMSVLYR